MMHKQIPLLSIRNLSKKFSIKQGSVHAVSQVSLDLYSGETLGLVGESGCGKSTIAKLALRLLDPTEGDIAFLGRNILNFSHKELKAWRREISLIFQDPYASLNPRMTAEDIVREPFHIHKINVAQHQIDHLFKLVQLNLSARRRFPHEFSGGQRQRIGIARALALTPKLIICDEPIAALDVSVQAQIVNLLKFLQKELNISYLFISHDLRMIKYISHRIGVMYLGNLVEIAPSTELYANPLHPYTQALLSAIPIPNPNKEKQRKRIILQGEVPSPLNPPQGCVFCTRCPKAMPICHTTAPKHIEITPGHKVACHLY